MRAIDGVSRLTAFVSTVPTMATASVELVQLSKSFVSRRSPDVLALHDVSLVAHPGEVLVLFGPSGSGKTTTLRLIAGLETPSTGEVRIDGRSMAGIPPDQRGVAMVFQDQPLFSHLTVGENLALPLRLQKRNAAEIRDAVSRITEVLHLQSLLDRAAPTLSGGEQRRVALGMALLKQPRVLLLDEPWVHLDPRLRADLRHELRLLQRRWGLTVLLVTHDRDEALSLGDRIAMLHRGSLLQVGTPAEVYRRPHHAVVADGTGRFPVNWVRGQRRRAGHGVHFVADDLPSWSLPAPPATMVDEAGLERPILLGIRPEFVRASILNESTRNAPLRATLEAVESLGSESLLRCRVGSSLWSVPVESDFAASARAGQEVSLAFEEADALWFDADTSRCLTG